MAKRMTREVYLGLRTMRAYVNCALESAEFPEDEADLEQALKAQEWLDDFLNRWAPIYEKEANTNAG